MVGGCQDSVLLYIYLFFGLKEFSVGGIIELKTRAQYICILWEGFPFSPLLQVEGIIWYLVCLGNFMVH